MKREAFGHTKLKRFCRLFDIPVYQAVGILETLWHITATEAPRGDIGHLSDEQIALGLDWRGPEKPLIDALLAAHWLEPDPVYRLLIHDWPHHCDDSVHRKLVRAKLVFADNSVPNWSRLSGRDRAEAEAFYECLPSIVQRAPESPKSAPESPKSAPESPKSAPYPAPPCPAPPSCIAVDTNGAVRTHTDFARAIKPNPRKNGTAGLLAPLKRLNEFLARYPDKSDPQGTARAYARCNTPATEDACHACLDRYLASDRVARNVVQRGRNWLGQQSRNQFHGQWEPPPKPMSNARRSSFVDNVTEVITTRLAKGEKPW